MRVKAGVQAPARPWSGSNLIYIYRPMRGQIGRVSADDCKWNEGSIRDAHSAPRNLGRQILRQRGITNLWPNANDWAMSAKNSLSWVFRSIYDNRPML
jgi:hypothetical protein